MLFESVGSEININTVLRTIINKDILSKIILSMKNLHQNLA